MTKGHWDSFCLGVEAMCEMSSHTYAYQVRPIIGKIDLAGVFFSRPRLYQENIFFSNFTDPKKFPCLGCQDGYFTQFLVDQLRWTYRRLPLDGLKSLVFHGPSPTWCVASGNVWFDHPSVNSVRCYSHRVIEIMRNIDNAPFLFDWAHYDNRFHNCIRFSNHGYLKNREFQSGVYDASKDEPHNQTRS